MPEPHRRGCGADSIGLVFVPSSPRCVTIDGAYEIQSVLPAFVTSVGLFVNPKAEPYLQTMVQADLDLRSVARARAPGARSGRT